MSKIAFAVFFMTFGLSYQNKTTTLDSKVVIQCPSNAERCDEKNEWIFKDKTAIISKCGPMCVNVTGEIRLKDSSKIRLEYGAILNVFPKGSLDMKRKANLIENLALISNHGKITLDSANVTCKASSEILNKGEIQLGGSVLSVVRSFVQVSEHGKLIQEEGSKLKVDHLSSLELDFPFDQRNYRQELLMKNQSIISLTAFSSVKIYNGRMIMNKKSIVNCENFCVFEIQGFLEMSINSNIVVGYQSQFAIGGGSFSDKGLENTAVNNSAASLVFAKDDLFIQISSQRQFRIEEGAHCTIKKSYYANNDTILDSNTKNEFFDCYGTKFVIIPL